MNLQWQASVYILVGLAEVFTAITYYDLFYSEVPATMRSVCQVRTALLHVFLYLCFAVHGLGALALWLVSWFVLILQ